MEYADEGCRLIRAFSDGQAQVTLAFERFSLDPSIRLGLTGANLRASSSTTREVEFRYVGSDARRTSELLESVLADGRKAFLLPDAALIDPESSAKLKEMHELYIPSPALLAADLDAAKQISAVTFSKGFAPMTLDLGPMGEPMKAMRRCVEDLVAGWGIDVARLLKAKQPPMPIGNPARWVMSDDYPPKMLQAGLGGLVRVRIIIEEDGAIGKCMVEVVSPGDFEKLVCANLAKRAKFTPAIDAEGKPFRSYWVQTWRFLT